MRAGSGGCADAMPRSSHEPLPGASSSHTREQKLAGTASRSVDLATIPGPDWDALSPLLERTGHAIRANGAAFAVDPKAVPANVLICSCGWRGHYPSGRSISEFASVPLALSLGTIGQPQPRSSAAGHSVAEARAAEGYLPSDAASL